jgi:hypothetical protein
LKWLSTELARGYCLHIKYKKNIDNYFEDGMKIKIVSEILTKSSGQQEYQECHLCDLYIGVHLKGTKKFGSKVINKQLYHRKNVFHMKILS